MPVLRTAVKVLAAATAPSLSVSRTGPMEQQLAVFVRGGVQPVQSVRIGGRIVGAGPHVGGERLELDGRVHGHSVRAKDLLHREDFHQPEGLGQGLVDPAFGQAQAGNGGLQRRSGLDRVRIRSIGGQQTGGREVQRLAERIGQGRGGAKRQAAGGRALDIHVAGVDRVVRHVRPADVAVEKHLENAVAVVVHVVPARRIRLAQVKSQRETHVGSGNRVPGGVVDRAHAGQNRRLSPHAEKVELSHPPWITS